MLARCEERGWVPLKCNCVSYLASEDGWEEWGVPWDKERLQGVQRGQEVRLLGSGAYWGQGRHFRGPRGSKGSSRETRGTPRGLRGSSGRFSRLEICQKYYTTRFSGQKFYTLKVRKLRLFLLKKKCKCIDFSWISSFFCKNLTECVKS